MIRFDHVRKLSPDERCFCQKCGELFPKTEKGLHMEHSEMLEESINDLKLSRPSQVMIIIVLFFYFTVKLIL